MEITQVLKDNFYLCSIELEEYDKEYELDFIREQPIIDIVSIEGKSNFNEIFVKNNVQFLYSGDDGSTALRRIDGDTKLVDTNKIEVSYNLNLTRSSKVTVKVEKPQDSETNPLPIIITYRTKRIYGTVGLFDDFRTHISSSINRKIIFSAPFGHGKSTFLDLFFDEHSENYNTFKVFPIHYSISVNQDVFKYIKAAIFFQLFSHDSTELENNRKAEPIEIGLLEYMKKYPKKMVSDLAKIGVSLAGYGKIISTIEKRYEAIKDYNNDSTSELERVNNYLKRIVETEGSIFEDNILTQIIRQQLEILKEQTQKENVLVIEDLDRIDPAHIFRILNIISAQMEHSVPGNMAYGNKFGFDRIILVCDINNIESVFLHQFGKQADFNGYINKFYSSTPFHFNFHSAAHSLTNELIASSEFMINEVERNFRFLFNQLINTKSISLRNLYSFFNFSLDKEINRLMDIPYFRANGITQFIPVIRVLLLNISPDDLIEKLKLSKLIGGGIRQSYLDNSCLNLVSFLANERGKSYPDEYEYKLYNDEEITIRFKVRLDPYNRNMLTINDSSVKFYSSPNFTELTTFEFSSSDFYDLLILNIRKYQRLI